MSKKIRDAAAVPAPEAPDAASGRATLSASGLQLGLELPEAAVDRLIAYVALIAKWGRVYNLTAVRDPAGMLTQHIVDSLAVVPPLQRETGGRPCRVLDVGSGAGLPGVVVAICCPELQVDCVDAVAKKATFIRQVALELRLPNLRSMHARVETVAGPYELITSRAFASLGDFVRLSGQALAADGVWMALKGKRPDDEIAALPPNTEVFHVEQLDVPGLAAERCIIWLRRRSR